MSRVDERGSQSCQGVTGVIVQDIITQYSADKIFKIKKYGKIK